MPDLVHQEVAASSTVIVVKVGTRVLTGADGLLCEKRVAELAEEICRAWDGGRRVILVSSGAVGAGMGRLGLAKRPADLAQLQAVAAVGQSRLVETYERAVRTHGRHAGQVLLTAEDVNDRQRYLNVRNTILALLAFGAVPIVNENDTVSVAELQTTFGDNDQLAAIVTNLVQAPLLVMLSDVQGLFDGPPDRPGSQLIPTVTRIDDQITALVQDTTQQTSKGGMASKLQAAKKVTTSGGNVIIASGRLEGVLSQILAGEQVGTLFLAQGKTVTPWKRWIGFTVQPRGRLVVDAGARQAVETKGRSLLAIGVRDTMGDFEKGDIVALCDESGQEFARGLTNYASREVGQIKGLRTDKIAAALGHCPYEEVIHRDNMVVTT
jgi:glutamate 5-kinase